mmetsp:Transcript_15529/g.41652  ORF Transcript_15529/g.41652 Transcript_15529/m.41652 type:complete len:239 (+) Transcript_15529:1036-1752(+)
MALFHSTRQPRDRLASTAGAMMSMPSLRSWLWRRSREVSVRLCVRRRAMAGAERGPSLFSSMTKLTTLLLRSRPSTRASTPRMPTSQLPTWRSCRRHRSEARASPRGASGDHPRSEGARELPERSRQRRLGEMLIRRAAGLSARIPLYPASRRKTEGWRLSPSHTCWNPASKSSQLSTLSCKIIVSSARKPARAAAPLRPSTRSDAVSSRRGLEGVTLARTSAMCSSGSTPSRAHAPR